MAVACLDFIFITHNIYFVHTQLSKNTQDEGVIPSSHPLSTSLLKGYTYHS